MTQTAETAKVKVCALPVAARPGKASAMNSVAPPARRPNMAPSDRYWPVFSW